MRTANPKIKNNKDTFLAQVYTWSNYRFRAMNFYQDAPRDFNDWRKICFKHQVQQSLCHCTETENHFLVTPKIAIPKKDDNKGWLKLKTYLLNGLDNFEATIQIAPVRFAELYADERTKLRLGGKQPNRAFFKE